MLQKPDIEYLKKVKTILSEYHKKEVVSVLFAYNGNEMSYTFKDGQTIENSKQNYMDLEIAYNNQQQLSQT